MICAPPSTGSVISILASSGSSSSLTSGNGVSSIAGRSAFMAPMICCVSTEYVPSSFLVMPRQRLFQSGNATVIFAQMPSIASMGSGGAPGGPISQPSAHCSLADPSARPVQNL